MVTNLRGDVKWFFRVQHLLCSPDPRILQFACTHCISHVMEPALDIRTRISYNVRRLRQERRHDRRHRDEQKVAQMAYCVITADVKGSRDFEDRAALQESLKAAMAQVNDEFAPHLVVPFTITIGDEWQGVLRSLAESYDVAQAFARTLEGVSVVFGIGEGEISTPVAERSAEMDGEAFHRSREALEKTKTDGKSIAFRTVDVEADKLLNALCGALELVSRHWTDKQRKAVALFREHRRQVRVAELMGVTKSDISQALLAAGADVFLECEDDLISYLKGH